MPVQRIHIAAGRPQHPNLATLDSDLRHLGYEVTVDEGVPGGEVWWRRSLSQVAAADLLVYALAPSPADSSMESPICRGQREYAEQLGLPILPVRLDEAVDDSDLPQQLGRLQRVEYADASLDQMIRLFKEIQNLDPSRGEAPTAQPPECPRDYALEIIESMGTPESLPPDRYDQALRQIQRYVKDQYTWSEIEHLVAAIRNRRDFTRYARVELERLEAEVAARGVPPPSSATAAHGPQPRAAGEPPVRTVFCSYSRSERRVVESLVSDLESLGFKVSLDKELPGGHPWWATIIKNIAACDALVFAAGDASRASKACNAEVQYAVDLGKRVARICIDAAPIGASTPDVLDDADEIQYTPSDRTSVARIASALRSLSRTELPTVMPPDPEVPATYLYDVKAQIESPEWLKAEEQTGMIEQLRRYVTEGVSTTKLRDLVNKFIARRDTTEQAAKDADEILERLDRMQPRDVTNEIPRVEPNASQEPVVEVLPRPRDPAPPAPTAPPSPPPEPSVTPTRKLEPVSDWNWPSTQSPSTAEGPD